MFRNPNRAVASDMRSVVSDVENLLHSVGERSGGTVHEFRSRLGTALDAARSRLDALDGSVRSGARQAVVVTDDYAHSHPWQVLAAGALLGVAAGLLIATRRR
jgi:ElaB/YqjD/DUF883 family membrane-anchored ribosome-binding protein